MKIDIQSIQKFTIEKDEILVIELDPKETNLIEAYEMGKLFKSYGAEKVIIILGGIKISIIKDINSLDNSKT